MEPLLRLRVRERVWSEFFALLHNLKNLDLVQILKETSQTSSLLFAQLAANSVLLHHGICKLTHSIGQSHGQLPLKQFPLHRLDKFTGKSSPKRFPSWESRCDQLATPWLLPQLPTKPIRVDKRVASFYGSYLACRRTLVLCKCNYTLQIMQTDFNS